MSSNTRKWPVAAAGVISWMVLTYAVIVSGSHIIEVAFKIGIDDWQAWTAPGLVDAVMIAGKLGRLSRFTDATRRAALKLFMFGGTLSLVCNVYAGYPAIGRMAHGLVVVVIMVWLESYVAKMELRQPHAPAAAPTSPGRVPVPAPSVAEVAAIVEDDPAAIAFRRAQAELRRESRLARLNG